MKIIKPLSLGVLHKPYQVQGQNYLSVAAIGFFRLGAENERFLSESLQWPKVIASLPAGQPLDEVMPKQKAEALLLGSAHSPGGKPCTELCVCMCVADIVKSLCIRGNREWRYGLAPLHSISKPKPFSTMPLVYQNAYGGAGHPANPLGCGYTGNPLTALIGRNMGSMPNIEAPGAPITSHWRRSTPAGFGPLQVAWTPRKNKFGTYNKVWLKNDAPGFARDIDWSVFNLAPPDQWSPHFFQGGEAYRLLNLHPKQTQLDGHLPQLQASAFVLKNGQNAEQAAPIALRMDTVWFLPEHDLGIAIYHGQTEIDDSDGLDVAALMVAYEDPAQPKSLEHYRRVMALRLDSATAAHHAFNESQLAADRSPPEQARRAAAQQQAEAAELAKRQRQLDLIDAEFWTKNSMTPPADYVSPKAQPMEFGLVTTALVTEGDFDLSKTIAHAQTMANKAEQQGRAALDDMRKKLPEQAPSPAASDEQILEKLIERAMIPAYDLLPAGETGCDPQVAQQLAQLEQAQALGKFSSEAQYQQARQAVIQIPAQRRAARRASPTPTVAELPLSSGVARQFGQRITGWQLSGICLAGRDLPGANLAGCDFSGADLRQVMLEGADLSQATFAGANLHGAVLTGAKLDGTDFSNANLAEANLSNSSGKNIRFQHAQLSRAQALSASWQQADLRGAIMDDVLAVKINLSHAILDDVSANRAILLQAQADDSSWLRASLIKTVLLRASMQRCDVSHAKLNKTILIEAQLQHSRWDHAQWLNVQATGKTDFSHASLRAVKASDCGLHGVTLSKADLRAAQFLRCDFGQCNLQSAQMDDGIFSYSLFLQANLRCVSARRADFLQTLCRKTDFSGADLDDASFAQSEQSESIGVDGKTERARRAA